MFDNYCVRNVTQQFNSLTPYGENLCISARKGFKKFDYTWNLSNKNIFGLQNHFQGIVRRGSYLFISGGNNKEKKAQLIIAKVGSEEKYTDYLRSNILKVSNRVNYIKFPYRKDSTIKSIDITVGPNWHAGGISNSGDILVIPLEEFRKDNKHKISSAILVYDISNPENPHRIEKACITSGREGRDAGSSFIYRLDNGKFIIGVRASHVQGVEESLDLYISKSDNIEDGLEENMITAKYSEVSKLSLGQSMGIVKDCESGQLFLLIMETIDISNHVYRRFTLQGHNMAYLHKISFNLDSHNPLVVSEFKEGVYHIDKNLGKASINTFGNFGAAAGINVNSNNEMSILSAAHFRTFNIYHLKGRMIKLKEFYPSVAVP